MKSLKSIFACSVLLSTCAFANQQAEVFNTGRLSPLGVDSQRGTFQNRTFEAFQIPEYKLDQAYIDKAREEIATLKRVLNSTQNINQRSDAQHRLAEAYWEVERTVYLRQMEQYQKNMDLFQQKKIQTRPKAPNFSGKESFKYYQEIIKTNPRYSRMDEILFYAGYRGQDASQKDYQKYLQALVKQFPQSVYAPDAYFKLGEHHFEKREFDEAIENFNQILKTPNKLHNQAMYKISWCYFNQHKFELAKRVMQKVVESSRDVRNELDLRQEALRDLVLIYSELGQFVEADQYFTSIGEPEYAVKVLEQLSDIYFDQSRYDLAIKTISLLLSKVPNSPEAPKYHSKLVDCYDRSQRLTTAMKEMNRFLATYEPESRWHRENVDKDVRLYAHNRSEVYSRYLAKRYHEESQKYEKQDPKKSENFALTAMGFYRKYFERFADHPQAYELRMLYAELLFERQRFEIAAEQFKLVFSHNPKGKFAKKALTGQIDSITKIETENYKKISPIAEQKKIIPEELALPDLTKDLIQANINYAKVFPKDPVAPEVYFQHAQLYYNYNHFDHALTGFNNVIKLYPNTNSADRSRHLILDIYNIKRDWVALEKTAVGYLTVTRFATDENKVILLDLIQGAIFQQGKAKEDEKKYVEAAQIFENLAQRYPDSKYGDKALFNAAINYIKADQSAKAIATSNAFLQKYPNSDLAPQMLIAMAAYFDEKLDYPNTARYYELYVSKDPKSPTSPDALFNAAVYREHLLQYNQAIANYQNHEKLFPASKDRETVIFSQGLIYEKQKQYSNAIATFERFIQIYGKNSPKTVEAQYRVAENQVKLNQITLSQGTYKKVLEAHKRAGSPAGEPNHYASKAYMKTLEKDFRDYQNIKLVMPQRVLEQNMKRKFDLLRELRKEYLKVIKMNDPEVGVDALYKLALTYQGMSEALFSAPIPSNLSPEEVQMYQTELQKQALPIEEQAIESFESALKKAHELQIYTQTTKDAYAQLSQYKPKEYPAVRFPTQMGEYTIEPWSTQYEGSQK